MGLTVAPAWAEWVNKELGGINGHPVQVITVDDKGDPVFAQTVGKQLIDDGVQAVVATNDNLLATYDSNLIAAKIPIVSGPVNIQDWTTKPGMFPILTQPNSGYQLFAVIAKDFANATNYGDVYCSEVAACASAVPFQKAGADKVGLPFTQVAVSGSASSYTAQCLTFKQQKVDYVTLAVGDSVAAKFVQDCQAQGYNPPWGISQSTMGKASFALKGANIIGPAFALPETAPTPAAQAFRDAMTKYAKSDNWHNGNSVATWSGLEMIRKALSGVNASTPVTSATIMDAMYTIKDEDLNGLLANKITFTKGQPVPDRPCLFVLGLKDGTLTSLNDSKPLCPNS